jgi:hypothetical protein
MVLVVPVPVLVLVLVAPEREPALADSPQPAAG